MHVKGSSKFAQTKNGGSRKIRLVDDSQQIDVYSYNWILLHDFLLIMRRDT